MNDIDFSKTPELFSLPLRERYNKIFKYLISSSYWKKFRERIFDDDLNQLSFTNKKDIDKIIKYGKITDKTNAVDIGCGVSEILEYIYKKTNAKLYGFDISDYAVEYQKEKIGSKVELKVNDLKTIDFNQSFYDVIYSVDSHYFIKDKMQLFDKIYKGLKNKGRLILFTQIFDHEKPDLRIDEIFMFFINDMKEAGYNLILKKDLTKRLIKMSDKQIKYWKEYKNGLINEIPAEIWNAFNREHHWTKNMLENSKLKRYFLVFEK